MSGRLCHWRVWFILLLLVLPAGATAGEPIDITILHVNDTHGHIVAALDKGIDATSPVAGAGQLAAMVREERTRNPQGTLLLSAGDMFQGTPISNVFQGEPVIAVMNALQFDAMALGNHEFDWGMDALRQLRASANFPFLSANIEAKSGGLIEGVKPFVLLERRGIKVAVIGMTTEDVAVTSNPDKVKDLKVLGVATILPGLIADARRQGADLIIVLSHVGLDADKAIAQAVPGIDLIVGGHSHTAVMTPVLIGSTLIAQAGCYGGYLGIVELRVAEDGSGKRRVAGVGRLRTVFSRPTDPSDAEIAAIVNTYSEKIRARFSEVVGEAAVDLTTSKEHETNLGNLLADVMRQASGADIAFQNSGGIRTDILKGRVTLEQVYTVLPFDNVLMTMDLPGAVVLQLLEQSAASDVGVLQMSGVSVVYGANRPVGQRVVTAVVGGTPLDPAKTYRIATNDFLAAGGDKFTSFAGGSNIGYGDNLRDVFVSYLKQHSPVMAQVEGRVSTR